VTYSTISIAHDTLMNRFNATQIQLLAVQAKLEEATKVDQAYLKDVFGDPVQRVEYENLQKKLMNLCRIEKELSIKKQMLADAIEDFDKHDW